MSPRDVRTELRRFELQHLATMLADGSCELPDGAEELRHAVEAAGEHEGKREISRDRVVRQALFRYLDCVCRDDLGWWTGSVREGTALFDNEQGEREAFAWSPDAVVALAYEYVPRELADILPSLPPGLRPLAEAAQELLYERHTSNGFWISSEGHGGGFFQAAWWQGKERLDPFLMDDVSALFGWYEPDVVEEGDDFEEDEPDAEALSPALERAAIAIDLTARVWDGGGATTLTKVEAAHLTKGLEPEALTRLSSRLRAAGIAVIDI